MEFMKRLSLISIKIIRSIRNNLLGYGIINGFIFNDSTRFVFVPITANYLWFLPVKKFIS